MLNFDISTTHMVLLKHVILATRLNQQCITHCATLTVTGRQASARPISSTPRKKKLELEARNGRVAGRQLFTSETYEQKSERNRTSETFSDFDPC